MATATVPVATSGTDKLPSGSWSFGPVNIQWSQQPNNQVHVEVSVLGFDIDNLTGTLSSNNSSLSETLDILGLVKGDLELTSKFGGGPSVDGLWVTGQISAGSWQSGQLNHRIIPW